MIQTMIQAGILTLVSGVSGPQDAPADSLRELAAQQEERMVAALGGPIVLELDSLRMMQFTPENVGVIDLYQTASALLARSYFVAEKGGINSSPVSNLSMLGDSLVIYDTEEYVKKVLTALDALDVPRVLNAAGNAPAPTITTAEFRPRHISLQTAERALRPFERKVYEDGNPRGKSQPWANISDVPDHSLLILRDTEAAVAEMLELLERIDVPEQQVLLTCYMIRGKKEANSGDLPVELTTHLTRLVPQFQFESLGMAMVQTTAAPGSEVELRIGGIDSEVFNLRFRAVAFDERTASLTVEKCSLEQELYQDVFSGPDGIQKQRAGSVDLFTTNTMLRGGEYTVLGATGTEPVFLVLRITPWGGTASKPAKAR